MDFLFFKKKRVISDSKNKLCPQCLNIMIFSFKANILVYTCEKCGLIWIDNDELKRIIKLSKEDYIYFSEEKPIQQKINQQTNIS